MAGRTIETLTANPAAEAGRFLDADDKEALAGKALRIVAVVHDARNRFGPRWLVSVIDLATGEKLALGLADNAARDAMFPGIDAVLSDEGADAIEPVVLYRQAPAKGGNPFWSFRTATPDEIDAAEEAAAGAPIAPDDVPDGDDLTAPADLVPAPVLAKGGHRARA